MTTTRTYTDQDRAALICVRARIDHLRRETERHIAESGITHEGRPATSSEWQFEACLVGYIGITHGRIKRLVDLGLLESRPSDGHGPSIRINPERL